MGPLSKGHAVCCWHTFIKTIEATKALVEEYGKQSTEYYAGLISAYSNLDQFERADNMAYEATESLRFLLGKFKYGHCN